MTIKNLLLSLSLISLLSSTAAFAGWEEDALEAAVQDDPKCSRLVKQILTNEYVVDWTQIWTQFDFKNPDDEKKATLFMYAVDAYCTQRIRELFIVKTALSGQGKLNDAEYRRAVDAYTHF